MTDQETTIEADWRMVDMNEWRAEQAANLARMVALKDELLQAENRRIAVQIERDEASEAEAKVRREDADRLYVRVAALNSAACLLAGQGAAVDDVLYTAQKLLPWLKKGSGSRG